MQDHGFSLLEMVIVLLILGILLSFAYPSYQSYWIKAHRLEGQMALLELANKMEQYFAQYGTYAQASIGSHTEHDVLSAPQTAEGWYILSIHLATAEHYCLQAIPQHSQAQQDQRCQSLQLTDQGIQSVVPGPAGHPTGTWEECWS